MEGQRKVELQTFLVEKSGAIRALDGSNAGKIDGVGPWQLGELPV